MNYGRYQIEGELGRGSMGVVYTAHDPHIDRAVALKVLRQDRVTSEEFVQRFLKEAKAIGRLSHPNIVTVYDAGRDHETIYIAMEYLVGKTLNEVIREKRLSHEEVGDIGVRLADTLDYVHSQGIVHRDIKPSNIFLTSANQPIITDFGIARIEDPLTPQQTQAGEVLGTPVYMSPEQVMGEPVDGRTDLYSLGVILYELTTGRRPFRGGNLAAVFRAVTQDTPLEPVKIDPSISRTMSGLIMKSLNKRPDKRFQTGKEMAEALKACHDGVATRAMPEAPIKKKPARLGLLLLIAFIMLSAGGGLFYYFVPETPSGFLKVNSLPTDAQVFVGDSFKGKTPLELELPVGKYEIRVRLHDYHEWEAQLQVEKEGEVPLFVRLIPVNEREP
jgi:serine/threonine protein kinase